MKRIQVSDPHLSGYQSDIINSQSGLTQRLHNIMGSLSFAAEYGRTNNIKYIDIDGDLINDKDVIYTDAQNAFAKFLLKYSDINFTLLTGNHDLSSTGEFQSSACSVFSDYKNVRVVNEVLVDGDITYLPFSNHIGKDLKNLKGNKILISHFGLSEGMLQSGLSVISEVKISDLKKFKMVILGHYHKPQKISGNGVDVYYCGSVCHHSWNDKNEQKRFLVIDTDTLEVQSIDFTGFTEYKEYIIDTPENAVNIMIEAEKAKNFGHHVRVRKMFQEEIKNESNLVLIEEKKDIDITNRGLDLTQSDTEIHKKYLSIKEIPENEHDEYIKVLQKVGVL